VKPTLPGIRIVSINTAKCDGPYTERLDWMLRELRRLEPDIVALQEAFRAKGRGLNTARTLAAGLEMNLFWTPARLKCRTMADCADVFGWSGMAMLTRGVWLETHEIALPGPVDDADRKAQIGLVSVGRVRIIVANVHLTHLNADGTRTAQLSQVVGHPLMSEDHGLPRILCGDFNSTLDGPVLRPLVSDSAGPSLKDTFDLGGGAGPRSTLAPRPGSTKPMPCIDYIFSLASSSASHPLYACSQVVLDRRDPETGVLPSDHYGVATTLVLPDRGGW
jgi:endonuclease/exonuclease/phosphatase family metal-dependent hydrolase